ncbi:glycosyltransferase [Rhodoferax sp.]|uniref:glycosyltransferase n=1 Tax=Rhodoferax sp. TaxID=50421 RepID=UPI0027377437|nr:glycosyltransferase [Rhodoferax sp.]MDP3190365.1 glycosyltransferase [Rhodoferax sp.]
MIIPSWFDPEDPHKVSPFIFEQALALMQTGVNVGILYVGFSGGIPSFHRCEVSGIPILSVTLPRILRRMKQLSLGILRRAHSILYGIYKARHGAPTLIHAHSMYAGGICAAHLARQHKHPFVVTEHFSGYSLGTLKVWQLRAIRKAAERSTRMFFVSETLRRDSEEQFPQANWKILTNNYSAQLTENIPCFRSSTGREYFCIVARLDINKNVAMCLRAFAMLPDKSSDLFVIGTGIQRDHLQYLARDLNISHRILFHGAQSRVKTFSFIKGAAAVIICSGYETFGMTVIEAAMLGTPVISTKCGGPTEIMGDDFGLLIDKDDIEGLTKAMQEAVVEKAKFKCDDAKRIVALRYSPARIAAQLKAEYAAVILEQNGRLQQKES